MFELNDRQREKLAIWSKEQDQKVIEKQKGTPLEHADEAYYGCAGGSLTYLFTPTTIGLVIEVKNNYTGEMTNLTDYDEW